jgi:hypothetical protein
MRQPRCKMRIGVALRREQTDTGPGFSRSLVRATGFYPALEGPEGGGSPPSLRASAKQSIARATVTMDCFVASAFARRRASADKSAPRNDELRHNFAISRRNSPEVCWKSPYPLDQRAQGKPDARCTRGLVCKSVQKTAHEHTGPAEAIRLSLRNGFNAYFRALPGDRACLTPSPANMAVRARLG